MSDDEGGRIFFSNIGRSLEGEDEIELTSVGVDIGSSTSHLVFSRILLEQLDNRYLVSRRELTYESKVILTPYLDDETIDADTLGRFIERQYAGADIDPRVNRRGRIDPDRSRGPPPQRPADRRTVRRASRKVRRGQRRRRSGNDPVGIRVGGGGQIAPREYPRHECRRRRRHVQGCSLCRRPSRRHHGRRRRRATGRVGWRRPGETRRRRCPARGDRDRRGPHHWSGAGRGRTPLDRRANGGTPVRRHEWRKDLPRNRGVVAPATAQLAANSRCVDLFRRRRRIHLWSRSGRVFRSGS